MQQAPAEAVGITYDTGALLAADANRRDIWALHSQALLRGQQPVIPAAVLAQAWRGGPHANLSRLLKGCVVETFDEARARSAGALCARSRSRDIVDAAVVAGALARDDMVITSDADDLRGIAASLDRALRLHCI